ADRQRSAVVAVKRNAAARSRGTAADRDLVEHQILVFVADRTAVVGLAVRQSQVIDAHVDRGKRRRILNVEDAVGIVAADRDSRAGSADRDGIENRNVAGGQRDGPAQTSL